MMLVLRSILFALLLPGTVTAVIPYFIVSRAGPVAFDHLNLAHLLGVVPMGIGVGILFWCIRDFAVLGRGTLAPVDPPTHLVVRGLYRYVRNPMYVGVLSILCGEALLFGSLKLLSYAGVTFVAIHLFVLLYEEPTLRRKFGESYDEYRRHVRRWLPRQPDDSAK